MIFNFRELPPAQAYHLMAQTILPRPIAWVLTENESLPEEGLYNLAPFSYFSPVASDPPTLMLSIGIKPDGTKKDTLRNIERSRQLVIHIASVDQLEALNQSAATLPYGESELEASALTTTPFDSFALPRLQALKIAFACELDHLHTIGPTPQTLVFARIVGAYIDDEILHEDEGRIHINAKKLQPLARLGGNQYAQLGDLINCRRPA